MAFILLIFFVAAAISGVAAYFSLVGLGSIFAATFWGVVIMGAALEVGKIVTTKWVHTNWKNPSAPWYFRGLLCFFIACLMAITSLGIYGYLSRGHLEQQAPLAGLGIQVAQLETQLKQKQDENSQLQNRLSQISRITDKSLETSGRAGLRASNSQKRESADIQKRIDANNTTINDLTTKLVPLKMKTGDVEGELGVAKFIAEAMGWDPEKAIRIIISLIMAAFDPLALSMFIMGSISLKNWQEARKKDDDVEVVAEVPVVDKPVEKEEVSDLETAVIITEDEGEPIVFETANEVSTPLLAEQFKEHLEEVIERDHLDEDLAKIKEDIDRERAEFEATMAEVTDAINQEVSDLEITRNQIINDQAALQSAHEQLLDMEARINDERELLGQWEKDLTSQQETINAWRPERHDMEDGKNPKDLIIEVLEMNPDIVNDIVQVAIAMQNSRPGL